MRWAVEYTTATDMIGLCIFTAADIEAAEKYVTEMKTRYGHSNVFNLTALPSGATVQDLYQFSLVLPRVYRRMVCRRENMGKPGGGRLGDGWDIISGKLMFSKRKVYSE